ncbi:MAG: CoB--CoM heterodisulfide reductase iron-sulfur subunit B family protein [Planctomycetes bacterium]|nr:CoB--CoM heterodisulfide reductase iron-sulfur subunit B family protein [Planctomycetota bacterium]
MVRYAFYPGCSLDVSAVAYDESVKAVCAKLGVDLVPIADWNCCGATEYWGHDALIAQALIARNLARIDPELEQVTAPCAACYLNLAKVDRMMREVPAAAERVNRALAAGGLHYEPGRVRVRHLIDVLYEDVGRERLTEASTGSLDGLRVAPYYGCQVVRPFCDNDDSEQPVRMDEVLTWLGAEVVEYPVKSQCCGGHMSQISENEAFELIRRLLDCAHRSGAEVIACMCPMCQLNLDAYQGRVNHHFGTGYHLPVLFFTQVVGVALGIEHDVLGIGREIVPAREALRAHGATVVAAAEGGRDVP